MVKTIKPVETKVIKAPTYTYSYNHAYHPYTYGYAGYPYAYGYVPFGSSSGLDPITQGLDPATQGYAPYAHLAHYPYAVYGKREAEADPQVILAILNNSLR